MTQMLVIGVRFLFSTGVVTLLAAIKSSVLNTEDLSITVETFIPPVPAESWALVKQS